MERSVIGYLVNARAELERRAADLEDRLAALALEGRDLAAHAALIATFLGRAVAIEGAEGQAVAVHAPAGVPSAAADAAGYLANRRHVALRTHAAMRAANCSHSSPTCTASHRAILCGASRPASKPSSRKPCCPKRPLRRMRPSAF